MKPDHIMVIDIDSKSKNLQQDYLILWRFYLPIPKPFHLFPSRYLLTEKDNIKINSLRIATMWYFVKFLHVHEQKKADSKFMDTLH